MLGYLNNPEKTAEVLRDGWYSTGDIAEVDRDGFIFLHDRLSRYSKIAGEMVPHIAIEEALLNALEMTEPVVAVTAAPDEKRGEQLVVLFTAAAGSAERLHTLMQGCEIPNLWKPKRDNYVMIDALPTLGSGKCDLKQLKEIAREFVESRPGLLQRTVDRIKRSL
jgi:acyl-[acyl-carrier-protein]-phospholipid O-acyltransferase / long-chain-fatty-acid--[acyl-carrier-protein] ligase